MNADELLPEGRLIVPWYHVNKLSSHYGKVWCFSSERLSTDALPLGGRLKRAET